MSLKQRIFLALTIITGIISICVTLYVTYIKSPVIVSNITVWIHGTRGSELFPVFLSQKLATVIKEICFCPPGLHAARSIDKHYHMRTIAQVLDKADPDHFPLSSFYIFGWSGALSFSERKDAAQKLYQALATLSKTYTDEHGVAPKITLISHSHGGNVALNMGMLQTNLTPSFFVDRLVLLACPAQMETAIGLHSPLFKKIYSIHSHMDALQILDPQGLYALLDSSAEAWNKWSFEPIRELFSGNKGRPVFSERHFKPMEKLTQVRVKWEQTYPWNEDDLAIFSEFRSVVENIMTPYLPKQRDLLHVEFILPSFLQQLPRILSNLDATPDTPIETFDVPDNVDRIVYI